MSDRERETKPERHNWDSGWQLQQKPATVHLMLEEALVRVTKQPREQILLVGASRTDAGVHALGQASIFVSVFSRNLKYSVYFIKANIRRQFLVKI